MYAGKRVCRQEGVYAGKRVCRKQGMQTTGYVNRMNAGTVFSSSCRGEDVISVLQARGYADKRVYRQGVMKARICRQTTGHAGKSTCMQTTEYTGKKVT